MGRTHHPRRGSMQFWPRKRARHNLARIRSWAKENQVKPLGFIGYKAGMTHVLAQDNRPKSITKGEKISFATTIIDCPPMSVVGISFYKNSLKLTSIFAEKLDKNLARKIKLPKKTVKKITDVPDFDDLRLLVSSQPPKTTGIKKPKLIEIALGGLKEAKLTYAQENLGKGIMIKDVFAAGAVVDFHGITHGKGFQGTVKRYGVPIRQHKSEKTKRGIGNLGSWTPKRVQYTVAQPGKMGYHLRTEYNKQILKFGEDNKEVVPKSGLHKYGIISNSFVLIKGSVVGPRKRAVMLISPQRPNKKMIKEAFEIISIRK